ncbi:MAG: RNA 3'-terminal phosphate cyclase [Nannocystaceae bacterium]|nr:RNA 3'-terminal phosphate cyclase [Nannocystaceae bacterium]
MTSPIEIDGSEGEGGGQILRSSLALSVITGTPVLFRNIRAKRAKPGLRRQHLAAVRAAGAISGAELSGDAVGSMELRFAPGAVQPGQHHVSIGTAGSTTLVLQTLLWPLLLADAPSQVVIEGGTHNPMAPTFEFLDRTFFPQIRRMGVQAELTLERHGFYPAGGGRLRVSLRPTELHPYSWETRGKAQRVDARALVSDLPENIARREVGTALAALGWQRSHGKTERVESPGPGNALLLGASFESGTTVVSSIGSKGKRAEDVASEAAAEMQRFLDSTAPIDDHLADQLLLPMALAKGGSFVTGTPSLHTRTNADVIARFLPVRTEFEQRGDGTWRVGVEA